jgi:quercetin dioxygenase-like cupin family protein
VTADDVTVSAEAFADRIIEPRDFVADTEAFVDVRIPHSKGKASYSFIGAGVSQNADQSVNLTVPHGFNVGAASMPSGIINNPHLHFTAEVFICTAGEWRMTVGVEGEQSFDISEGTVFSVPPWVFRGFQNIGSDEGFLYALLGGDDTGGIIWAPWVLREAAETGLFLDPSNAVLDATRGDDVSNAIAPLTADELATVDSYSDAELVDRAIAREELDWSDRALLSSFLPGHSSSMAPVIGHGMTQDRQHRPPITNPHGFSVEWLEIEPGSSTGRHRHAQSQALILVEGDWDIVLNDANNEVSSSPQVGSIVSIPAGAWRNYVNTGDTPARGIVVCGADGPTRIEWDPQVVAAVADVGWRIDQSGYIAPAHLVGADE